MTAATSLSNAIRDWLFAEVNASLSRQTFQLNVVENHLMTKLSDLANQLAAVADQLRKATDEIVTALGDAAIPPDAEAALDRVRQAAQTLDDLNPDLPVATATPESPA